MPRGGIVWYVVASALVALALYEFFLITGYDKTLGLFLTVLVYIVTIPIGLAAWVYQDARDRGWSGIFWALVTMFTPLGFAIYLIVRRPRGLETRGSVWYAMYGVVLPLLALVIGLWAQCGGLLLVIGVLIWMGFAIAMAAPPKDAQSA